MKPAKSRLEVLSAFSKYFSMTVQSPWHLGLDADLLRWCNLWNSDAYFINVKTHRRPTLTIADELWELCQLADILLTSEASH